MWQKGKNTTFFPQKEMRNILKINLYSGHTSFFLLSTHASRSNSALNSLFLKARTFQKAEKTREREREEKTLAITHFAAPSSVTWCLKFYILHPIDLNLAVFLLFVIPNFKLQGENFPIRYLSRDHILRQDEEKNLHRYCHTEFNSLEKNEIEFFISQLSHRSVIQQVKKA